MKFKKVFFLWLFLAIVFSCAKTNAKMIKIQSRYLGVDNNTPRIYAEIYMPYLEEIEKFLNNSIKKGDKLDRAPDVVIVIDNISYYDSKLDSDDEKKVYNEILEKKPYVLMREKNNNIGKVAFMADVDKFTQMAKDINSSTLNGIQWTANRYYDALKKLFEFRNNCRFYNMVWDII